MVYFWGVVLLIIAVFAIVDIVNSTKYSVRIGGKNTGVFYFIESSGEDKQLEFIIRETVKKFKWGSDVNSLHIVIIDKGMSEQTLRMCTKIADEYEFISVCKKDGVSELIINKLDGGAS